jgi:YD repeat-containing protein
MVERATAAALPLPVQIDFPTFTDPSGVITEYRYDAANRLAAIEIPGQGQVTYRSYRWNRPTRILLPGGGVRRYGYDPLMQQNRNAVPLFGCP